MCDDCVSIIVPVYKVEKYLPECIDSIVNQTYRNIEVILIDDGSPDKCPQICDNYALQDSRIKVVHKINGGLSDARNKGLDICNGKYVMFVDSDDIIHKKMVERLVSTLETENADIVECSTTRFNNSINLPTFIEGQTTIYNREDALRELILDHAFHQTVWNKIYTKKVVGNIIFPVGKYNEDEYWTYRVFANANKVVSLPDSLYFYRQRDNSIIHHRYSIKRLDALEAKVMRQEFIDTYFPELSDIAMYNLFISCLYAGQMTIKDMDIKEREVAWPIISTVYRKNANLYAILKNRQIPLKQQIWCLMGRFSLKITCNIRNKFKVGL